MRDASFTPPLLPSSSSSSSYLSRTNPLPPPSLPPFPFSTPFLFGLPSSSSSIFLLILSFNPLPSSQGHLFSLLRLITVTQSLAAGSLHLFFSRSPHPLSPLLFLSLILHFPRPQQPTIEKEIVVISEKSSHACLSVCTFVNVYSGGINPLLTYLQGGHYRDVTHFTLSKWEIFSKWPFSCLSASSAAGRVSHLLPTRAVIVCLPAELLFVCKAVTTMWQRGFNYPPLGFNISSLHFCLSFLTFPLPLQLFLVNRNRVVKFVSFGGNTLCGSCLLLFHHFSASELTLGIVYFINGRGKKSFKCENLVGVSNKPSNPHSLEIIKHDCSEEPAGLYTFSVSFSQPTFFLIPSCFSFFSSVCFSFVSKFWYSGFSFPHSLSFTFDLKMHPLFYVAKLHNIKL